MESQKSFANKKTAWSPYASVNPKCHRPMSVDVESFFTGERELQHMKKPSIPFYRTRHWEGFARLSHRISHNSPMRFIHLPQHFSDEVKEADRGAVTVPKHTGSWCELHPLAVYGSSLTWGTPVPGPWGIPGRYRKYWVISEASILPG